MNLGSFGIPLKYGHLISKPSRYNVSVFIINPSGVAETFLCNAVLS